MKQKKYNIIYADPPWAYKVWSKKGAGRSAESHYPTMKIEDIKALPVGELADKASSPELDKEIYTVLKQITAELLLPGKG